MGLPERIVLRPGTEQAIRLPSLSGAGYEWSVEIVRGDRESVAVEEMDPEAPLGPPGESPDHVFTVSALRPGKAELHFEQRRPWEDATPARDSRTFEVAVEK